MTQDFPDLPPGPPSENQPLNVRARRSYTWRVEEKTPGRPRLVYTDIETGDQFYDYPPEYFGAPDGQLVPTMPYTPTYFEREAEIEASEHYGVQGGF